MAGSWWWLAWPWPGNIEIFEILGTLQAKFWVFLRFFGTSQLFSMFSARIIEFAKHFIGFLRNVYNLQYLYLYLTMLMSTFEGWGNKCLCLTLRSRLIRKQYAEPTISVISTLEGWGGRFPFWLPIQNSLESHTKTKSDQKEKLTSWGLKLRNLWNHTMPCIVYVWSSDEFWRGDQKEK